MLPETTTEKERLEKQLNSLLFIAQYFKNFPLTKLSELLLKIQTLSGKDANSNVAYFDTTSFARCSGPVKLCQNPAVQEIKSIIAYCISSEIDDDDELKLEVHYSSCYHFGFTKNRPYGHCTEYRLGDWQSIFEAAIRWACNHRPC